MPEKRVALRVNLGRGHARKALPGVYSESEVELVKSSSNCWWPCLNYYSPLYVLCMGVFPSELGMAASAPHWLFRDKGKVQILQGMSPSVICLLPLTISNVSSFLVLNLNRGFLTEVEALLSRCLEGLRS